MTRMTCLHDAPPIPVTTQLNADRTGTTTRLAASRFTPTPQILTVRLNATTHLTLTSTLPASTAHPNPCRTDKPTFPCSARIDGSGLLGTPRQHDHIPARGLATRLRLVHLNSRLITSARQVRSRSKLPPSDIPLPCRPAQPDCPGNTRSPHRIPVGASWS